jgi:hypothetical protein
MSLFQIEEQKNLHKERAKGILAFGNQCATDMLRLYNMGKEMMWQVDGYKVEDAQKVLDELATIVPYGDLKVFQLHGAFGKFLETVGVIQPSEVHPPVSYKVENGKIILTGDRYPTEPLPEPESTIVLGDLKAAWQEPVESTQTEAV